MISPIQQLLEMESKSIEKNALIVSAPERASEWRGIVFKIGEYNLITDMQSVVEVLNPIECTRVPSSKPWFNGIANIRGQLVPISDLYGFLYDKPSQLGVNSRIMVFRLANTVVGLVISAVSGIRNFTQDAMDEDYPDLDDQLRPLIKGCFHMAGDDFPVFDFNRLISNERFMQITLASDE